MLNKIVSAILILLVPFISFAQWNQLGNDITGMEGDKLGTNSSISLAGSGQTLAVGSPAGSSIYLSADGNIIAVGEPWHNGVYGQVRVFEWINGNWEQIENEIDESGPPNSINSFGSAVSISANGSKVAIGAQGFEIGSFTDEGQVTIFENQSFVSIDDLDVSEISYYPNPTSHSLLIRSSNNIENVELFTMTGKRLLSVKASTNEFDLNMSDLNAGSYFVKSQFLGKVRTIKIVKL